MFKIKDGTIKLFASRKDLIDKKNGKNLTSMEIIEVILAQWNLLIININKIQF